MDTHKSTPHNLLRYAARGQCSKSELANLLMQRPRTAFLQACAKIERGYTEACTAANDPCLESGCSAEGEICLVPLLRAGREYRRAYSAEWNKLFARPENRVPGWQQDVADWPI